MFVNKIQYKNRNTHLFKIRDIPFLLVERPSMVREVNLLSKKANTDSRVGKPSDLV